MPTCGHTISIVCGKKAEYLEDSSLCTAECGCDMDCGHICKGRCGDCIKTTLGLDPLPLTSRDQLMERIQHVNCQQICGKNLFCLHACQAACHGGKQILFLIIGCAGVHGLSCCVIFCGCGCPGIRCPPCCAPCMMKCIHSHCGKKCGEVCPACSVDCSWKCEHKGQCKLPCGAPCNR